jgi:hypothetical protein
MWGIRRGFFAALRMTSKKDKYRDSGYARMTSEKGRSSLDSSSKCNGFYFTGPVFYEVEGSLR